MRPHYKTRECMMTPTILHLIRTIALMVLGWLPFQLGNTGNEQPENPTWNWKTVDITPNKILGYTNENVTWRLSGQQQDFKAACFHTPLALKYEIPWITER